MSTDNPRLRGNKARRQSPWPLGSLPQRVIMSIGRQLVHRMAVGQVDVTGDDFGTIFATAIDAEHRGAPLGLADVVLEGFAWSIKTVKLANPFTATSVRLLSGRNSPSYSLGIQNPFADVAETGRAILLIWNARVNESLNFHDELRIIVFIRNFETKEFVLFEEASTIYAVGAYRWEVNANGNFLGYEIATNQHKFTWQPHGAQFTIIRHVPGSATKFRINRNPPLMTQEYILESMGFTDDWVEIVGD